MEDCRPWFHNQEHRHEGYQDEGYSNDDSNNSIHTEIEFLTQLSLYIIQET